MLTVLAVFRQFKQYVSSVSGGGSVVNVRSVNSVSSLKGVSNVKRFSSVKGASSVNRLFKVYIRI